MFHSVFLWEVTSKREGIELIVCQSEGEAVPVLRRMIWQVPPQAHLVPGRPCFVWRLKRNQPRQLLNLTEMGNTA